jgi:hypothetical protein
MTAYREAVADIVAIQSGLSDFWRNAHGWAPAEGASLMASARLDRLPSLANALLHWSDIDALTEGELILAWANLGSLVESSLRLFLSVYITDYLNSQDDLAAIDALQRRGPDKGTPYAPDDIQFEKMRQLCERRTLFAPDELALISLVQNRRNAIHPFRDRDIGTPPDFGAAVLAYRVFIAGVASRLPYPEHLSLHWLDRATRLSVRASLRR